MSSTLQPIHSRDVRTVEGGTGIRGVPGVLYQDETGEVYRWDPAGGVMRRLGDAGRPTLATAPARSTRISLPTCVSEALWFPMSEGSGSVITDRVQGMTMDLIGTLTNAWDNAGWLTLGADVAARKYGSTPGPHDRLMRLDTLQGSIIVGCQILASTWVGSVAAEVSSYGDITNNTRCGWTQRMSWSNDVVTWTPAVRYCVVGGSTAQQSANTAGLLKAKKTRMMHWVLHIIGDDCYVDGYEGGWHSRSARITPLETANTRPGIAATAGLRIGARGTGTVGATDQYMGAVVTSPRLANWHAIRIEGDERHNIPRWIDDICASMPYGAIPRILSDG